MTELNGANQALQAECDALAVRVRARRPGPRTRRAPRLTFASPPSPSHPQADASDDSVRILERNISALFATAKLEVRRKDEEILRLRKL